MGIFDVDELEARRELRLCRALQAGDLAAERSLMEALEPLARSAASGFFAPGLTGEDLRQEALLAVLTAARKFDPDAGLSLRSFAWHVARRRVQTAVTGANRSKHGPLNAAVSLHAPVGAAESGTVTLADVLTGDEELDPFRLAAGREDMRRLLAGLAGCSSLERRALAAFASGCTRQEVALLVGSTSKAVDNAVTRARRKLRATLAA